MERKPRNKDEGATSTASERSQSKGRKLPADNVFSNADNNIIMSGDESK